MATTEDPVEPHEAAAHLFRAGARNPGVSGIRTAAVSSGTRPAISVSLEPASAANSGPRAAVTEGKVASIQSRHILWMAFGLPLMTAAISMGSMYLGHLITTQTIQPPNILVQPAGSPISVNVPQQRAPTIEVRPSEAQIQVHVPQQAPANVTFTPPAVAPPNITVNPPPATVTVIERKDDRETNHADRAVEKTTDKVPADASTTTATTTSTATAPASATPVNHTATPTTTTPAGEQPKLTAPKGNGNSMLPPVRPTGPLVDTTNANPNVAFTTPGTETKSDDETLQGEVLPRTPAEIERQQVDDLRRKK